MNAFRRRIAEIRLAFMLLTRIPVGRMETALALAQAAWAYPIVGAVVGGLSGIAFRVAEHLGLPPMLAALLAITASLLLTGAMHEDGLADVADGFGGGATKERKLEIMRDSRIGSYGVLALVIAIGLKAAALAALPPSAMVLRLAMLGAFSRALMPAIMHALPPARDNGLGQTASNHLTLPNVAAGLSLALLLVFLCHVPPRACLAMVLVAIATAWIARRQIGGFTGDVLGATQILTEIAGLLVLVSAAAGHPNL